MTGTKNNRQDLVKDSLKNWMKIIRAYNPFPQFMAYVKEITSMPL
jgi:hypothetical protein